MSAERTYTLGEAARELARRECANSGHDWDIVSTVGRGPVAVVCQRCGESRAVAEARPGGAQRP